MVQTRLRTGITALALSALACENTPSRPLIIPNPPTALTATAIAREGILLTWTDQSTAETEFHVELRSAAGVWGPLATTAVNTNTFMHTGLTAATTYRYRVLACSTDGCSAPSNEATATTPPPAVLATLGAVSATVVTINSATLNGTVNPNGSATRAFFEWGTDANFTGATSTTQQNLSALNEALPITASLTGLNAGTTYHYRLVAINDAGTVRGTAASFTTAIPTPAAPTQLVATPRTGAVDLIWRDNANNETEYRLEVRINVNAYQLLAVLPANSFAFTHSNLSPATTFTYRVSACNAGGCSATSQEVTTQTPPLGNAPSVTTVSASAFTDTGARLDGLVVPNNQATNAWFEYATNEALTNPASTPFQAAGAGSAAVSFNATLTGLAVGTTYYYRAVAQNIIGTSRGSIFTFRTTGIAIPAAPTALSATTNSGNAITINWTDASDVETEFRIEVSVGNTGTFTALATVAANVQTFAHTGLTPSTAYAYRVQACNATGCSAFSNVATALTGN